MPRLSGCCAGSVFVGKYRQCGEQLRAKGRRIFLLRHEILNQDQATIAGKLITPSSAVASTATPLRTRYSSSKTLPRGSQRKLTSAAVFSEHVGQPINTTVTINAARLQGIGTDSVFDVGHLWDGFRHLLELKRKWVTARGIPWIGIWVREFATYTAKQPGEHWHIGMHLPRNHRREYVDQLALWAGEDFDPDRKLDKGTFAASRHNAWSVSVKYAGGNGPETIGHYFGKAEPNRVRLHGVMKKNPDKVAPWYRGGVGHIEGKRFGMSRSLAQKAQLAAGFTYTPPKRGSA